MAPSNIDDGPYTVFEHKLNFPGNYLSFSQRRFLGFRNRYEFDKKRLLVASKKDFVIIGYDRHERLFELVRSFVSFDEEIRVAQFLEEHIPSFIFLISYNARH